MMNKKGFTLVELLGVLVIIALITALLLPKIIGWFSNGTGRYVELNEELIIDSARIYVEDHPNTYLKEDDAVYYITMQEMINYGCLDENNIKNIGRESYQDYKVKVVYNSMYFEYYLVND